MDVELRWHVTASWADVREKARRIRSKGGVRLVVVNPDRVVAHVRGDTEVYETEINRVPGRRQVAHWACACAWAAYSWGRTGRWRRFEGRLCSHALATQYEAQARGMFGRDVQVDPSQPHWLDPATLRQPGSYDRETGKHSALATGERDFTGVMDGRIIPLVVHPERGVMGPAGAVEPAAVTHPDYHPDLGLVLAGHPHSVESAVDEKQEFPTHAGLVLKARDTGRVLMLQRSMEDENEAAAGRWEWPGGKLEPGDHNTLHGAMREWAEEVGQPVPGGVVGHTWTSPNGVYQGHVMVIPSESALTFHDGRVTVNPDDPGGDHHEQAAWWDPDHARKNPALRQECGGSPWKEIKMATALLPNEPGRDEFGDLPAENGVSDDPDHALPVTYGDDEHTAALVNSELMRRTTARVGAKAFTPTEQQQVIDEGADVRAANLDRMDLTGTHYALVPDVSDDETWGW